MAATANGRIVNFTNPGRRFLQCYAGSFTADTIPDVIAKVAFDPGWGHYEAFGIARFFNDNVYNCPVNDISTVAGTVGTSLVAARDHRSRFGTPEDHPW